MKIFHKDKTYFFAFQINTQITSGVINDTYKCEEDLSLEEFLKDYLIKNKEKLTVKVKDKNDFFKVREFEVQNIAVLFFTEVKDEGSNKLL